MRKTTVAGICLLAAVLVFTGCLKKEGRENPVDPFAANYLPPEPDDPSGTVVAYVIDIADPPSHVQGANVYLYTFEAGKGVYTLVAHAVTDSQGKVQFNNVPIGSNYWLKCQNNTALTQDYLDMEYPSSMLWYEGGYDTTGFPVTDGRTIGATGGSDSAGFTFHLYSMQIPV